jgi:hypothetical protein
MTERLTFERHLTPEQASELVGERVPEYDGVSPLISSPAVLLDSETQKPFAAYLPLINPGPLRRACLQIEMSTVGRQRDYRSRSRTFGFAPRRPVMARESCTVTALAQANPEIEAVLETYADQVAAALDDIDPAIATADRATLGEIKSEWRIGKAGLWTSGVVNDTAALPYHRDGFNFPTWSAMPVVRRGVLGGHLHLPEYQITLACQDSYVVYFPGQQYVHGVTPLRRAVPGEGYRISVVYYALRGMKNCREAAEEAAQGRVRRTQREADMAARLAAGDREIPR